MKKIFAAVTLLVAMTACGGRAHHDLSLEGTTWKLTSMTGIPSSAINKEDDYFTLEFNADTMVSGRTNCNRFFGKYVKKDRKLDFENMGMTRMACPDMEYENAFVKMLDDVDRYEIKGSELTLYDDHKSVAVFKAMDKKDAVHTTRRR